MRSNISIKLLDLKSLTSCHSLILRKRLCMRFILLINHFIINWLKLSSCDLILVFLRDIKQIKACIWLLINVFTSFCNWSHMRQAIMKQINLTYNFDHQLLICIKHDYCIFYISLSHHLRALHEIKSDRLHATFAKTNELIFKDSHHASISLNILFISHLIIEFNYRCDISVCKLSQLFMNKNKRTIEKHLNKEHNVDHVKSKIQSFVNDIEQIRT